MTTLQNAAFGTGISPGMPDPVSTDAAPVQRLLDLCPAYKKTPLHEAAGLANSLGLGALMIKDERGRMGLGSFKALGAAFVIANQAAAQKEALPGDTYWEKVLAGRCFVSASAGNHGLSVAAGARLFGARSVIYLSRSVPKSFAAKLEAKGAEVVVEGENYEASMAAAVRAAKTNGWELLSDTTWEDYDGGLGVMQGYLVAASEVMAAWPEPPTHIFLQAGVGGFAAAMAAMFRAAGLMDAVITVVEPSAAPALYKSVEAGGFVITPGPISNMGRLDCKEPSSAALQSLSRTANHFMLVGDEEVSRALPLLAAENFATSPSGGAGFAGLLQAKASGGLGLNEKSRVLLFLTEGEAGD